jgi:hypothetical protein
MKSPICLSFNALALTAAITVVADRPPVACASAPFVVNDNGAWSWFEDERAVIDPANCTLLVSSVANGGGASCAVARFVDLFNALNHLGRRGPESAGWADEPAEASLLKRWEVLPAVQSHDLFLAKVRVAGSSPVVRSKESAGQGGQPSVDATVSRGV